MAATGIFHIPREFKNEDKWFRYFNKKQALVLVLMLLIDYRMITAAAKYGIVLAGIIIAMILTLLVGSIVMIELPTDAMFLTGGGITLDEWLLRVILRKRRKVIYTKHAHKEGA